VLGRDLPWPDGIRPNQRAEQLGIDRLIALADAYAKARSD
jgi:hypothetical protein